MVLFGKKQVIRRFGRMEVIDGYQNCTSRDIPLFMDVQEETDSGTLEESGKHRRTELKVFCNVEFIVADKENRQNADWLWVNGKWYECTSCIPYKNTLLKHYEAKFSLLPEQSPPPEVFG